MENKILFVTKLENLTNWSVQYLSEHKSSYKKDYNMVNIRDFLRRNKTPIEIKDDTLYRRITIKINNGGIFLRDKVLGSKIGTKKQFVVSKGQFLVSKIDARNGAFGVVPESLDGAIITGNFWTFEVDYSKINPHFLTLTTTTPEFIKFCQNASNGTTNRHYLQEELFLNQLIPLPTKEKQNLIVDSYNNKIGKAEEYDNAANELNNKKNTFFYNQLGIEKTENIQLVKGLNFIKSSQLMNWGISQNGKFEDLNFDNCKFVKKKIKNLLTFFEGGKTPSKSRHDFWNGDIYWTSPKDFSGMTIDTAEDKITRLAVAEAKMKVYPKGTILSVFRSGILRHSFPTAVTNIETSINQDVKAYNVRTDIIDKNYFLYFVNIFKDYILQKASKKGVTVESINAANFLEIEIPIPPIAKQKEILSTIDKLVKEAQVIRSKAVKDRSTSMSEFEKETYYI